MESVIPPLLFAPLLGSLCCRCLQTSKQVFPTGSCLWWTNYETSTLRTRLKGVSRVCPLIFTVCVCVISLFFLSCISIFIMLWSPIYSLSPLCTCPEYLSFTSNFFPKCSISADPLMYSFLILLIHKYTKEVEGKIHAI